MCVINLCTFRSRKTATWNDFVIPPNSKTFSDWRKTYHVSWVKTHLFPRARTKLTYFLLTHTWSGRATWKSAANLWASRSQANDFFVVFSDYWVGSYDKTLTGSAWNSEFCFPSTSMLIEGLGEIKISLFPLGSVIYLLMRFSACTGIAKKKKTSMRPVPRVSHLQTYHPFSGHFICLMPALSVIFVFIIERGVLIALVLYYKGMLEKVTMQRTPQFSDFSLQPKEPS